MDEEWEKYRLMDFMKGIPLGSPWEEYPKSLIDLYHKNGTTPGNIDVLFDIIRKQKHEILP